MLRTLLGEPPRVNSGHLKEAMDAMAHILKLLILEIKKSTDPTHDYRELEIWTRGLMTSLDELEQSSFAASFYAAKIHATSTDDMGPDEKADYARYVYFYKDGFIRMFAVLDKLGNVLDDWYHLQTSKLKAHFSYFTVLKQLEYQPEHKGLLTKLCSLKDEYHEPMNRLRKRRNTEIHHMNVEMQDDLWQRHQALHGKIKLEDLKAFTTDLALGVDLVSRSLLESFEYMNKTWGRQMVRS
ncbi:Cthe_2314 family HEPN domain-containing protein [Paenibacillus sp. Marseille-Q4541]|uniref:Cthe_2314 family HEPN domain-containing protein n=1 Tax=Paenibacillus sp. Marseille-Q4541 TaxID=2831522 RepID=UPI001BAD08CB|nr:Cthe_2314 family HEPN domain-containing protein [Paenibacillus sp. Marseille-Q4541]